MNCPAVSCADTHRAVTPAPITTLNATNDSRERESHTFEKKIIKLSKRPGEYFCRDCQMAKRDPGYAKCLKDYTHKILHCSGCNKNHTKALFHSSQWSEPDATRLCVAHQARVRVCKYLSMSLDEVQNINWDTDARQSRSGLVS